ncbi:MAG TPA: histidine phosphatase family protein [Candidatus Paceibacterota bacterium]|nr:histidine phosphatase family protein [Candidatus Paceibacterota bacterium]
MENVDKKPIKVNIFRHGKALYKQEETSLEEAEDLTEEGIEKVKLNAGKIAELIDPEEEVAIWSSSKGRGLHTAKIIKEVLKEKGINLRENGIQVFNELTEVKNFSWQLFEPLISGGKVEFAGKKFSIDKEKTNPDDLNYEEYFINDAISKIPAKFKKELPEEYVKEIEGLEKFFDITKRIMEPLSRIKKLKDKSYRVIIVTHDALTGFIANIFSEGKKKSLDPGEFINLEMRGDKLVVTNVGELEKGKNNLDVIEEFKKSNS